MRKVVFDVDSVLWDLNRRVADIVNVRYEDFVEYHCFNNSRFSKEQQNLILECYYSKSVYENIEWNVGADKIKDLEKLNCEVWITSHCLSEDIAKVKLPQLLKHTSVQEDHIILEVINVESSRYIDDAFILVDDSVQNLLNSKAKNNIVIDQPWNATIKSDELLKSIGVHRCIDLQSALDYSKILLSNSSKYLKSF